jgi:lysophospholipase L1-like esterase
VPIFVLLSVAADAAALAADAPFFLRPRDVVVFLGDSITERGRYIGYLEEYIRTSCREYQVRFINAAWGGDRVTFGKKGSGSPGALARVDRDVLSHQPTVVVVLMGMNDGRSRDPARLQEFTDGMRLIVRRIRERSRARVVLMTTTPYDSTRRPHEDPGVSRSIARFARAVQRIGRDEGATVVDLHTPMTRLVERCRKRKPPFVLIPDGAHPETAGHLSIACLLLRAWHAPLTPRCLIVSARAGIDRRTGCSVRAFRREGSTLRFERRLASLPLAVDERTRAVLDADGTVDRLCTDLLVVKALPERRYELRVDGRLLAVLSRERLTAGVDLTRLDAAPDHLQARRAAEIAHYQHRLRSDLWAVRRNQLAFPDPVTPQPFRRRVLDTIRDFLHRSGRPSPAPSLPVPRLPPNLTQRLQRLDRAWSAAVVPRWHQFVLVARP